MARTKQSARDAESRNPQPKKRKSSAGEPDQGAPKSKHEQSPIPGIPGETQDAQESATKKIKSAIEEFKNAKDDFAAAHANLMNHSDNIKKELATKEEDIVLLRALLKKEREEVADLKLRVASLSSLNEHIFMANEVLIADAGNKKHIDTGYDELMANNKERRRTKAELEATIKDSEKEMEKVRLELAEFLSQKAKLQLEAAQTQAKVIRLQRELRLKEDKLCSVTAAFEQLEENVSGGNGSTLGNGNGNGNPSQTGHQDLRATVEDDISG